MGHISYYKFGLNSFYLKLLISQSKFSGHRKFTLRYQLFWVNFNFEISKMNVLGITEHIVSGRSDCVSVGFSLDTFPIISLVETIFISNY